MKLRNLIVTVILALLAGACSTPRLGYFQDLQSGEVQTLSSSRIVRLQPGDKLSILVSSRNPELAYIFNLQVVGHYQSSTSGKGLTTSTVANYTVDSNGNIGFPVLGSMHVAGMTRSEVASYVKQQILNSGMLKDPTVTVDFLDMYFSVMGEVKTPGRFIIDHDQTTLLDALSRAGDLTIYGRRDNVLVTRSDGNKQTAYRIDLSNSKELYNSPAFYLQQNDIVYVEPNDRKARESTTMGNTLANPGLWISAASLVISIIVLIRSF